MIVLIIMGYIVLGTIIGVLLKIIFDWNDDGIIYGSSFLWPLIVIIGIIVAFMNFIKRICSNIIIYIKDHKILQNNMCGKCKYLKHTPYQYSDRYKCKITNTYPGAQSECCGNFKKDKLWIIKIDLD
jgi:hypothetical protein